MFNQEKIEELKKIKHKKKCSISNRGNFTEIKAIKRTFREGSCYICWNGTKKRSGNREDGNLRY